MSSAARPLWITFETIVSESRQQANPSSVAAVEEKQQLSEEEIMVFPPAASDANSHRDVIRKNGRKQVVSMSRRSSNHDSRRRSRRIPHPTKEELARIERERRRARMEQEAMRLSILPLGKDLLKQAGFKRGKDSGE
jgi:hypothetical protein